MSADTIPDDVRVAAKVALLRARLISVLDDQIDVIALAIMAERNRATEAERTRCVKIVDARCIGYPDQDSDYNEIIAEIRSPAQPTGE